MKSMNVAMRCAVAVMVALVMSTFVLAQEARSELSVQGTGFFTKDSDHNGLHNNATNSGGVLTGYRFNINHWLAAEADYGYTRNSQTFSGTTLARVQTNVHEITGAGVVKLPTVAKLHPFVLAGGGALVFDPTETSKIYAGATRETTGTFLYGGGADYNFTNHWALRAEYRGFVYKEPSFNVASLKSDAWTHTAQPSAGIVFKF